MTDAQLRELARSRLARLQPDVLSAVLMVFRAMGDAVSITELARFIDAGGIDRLLTAMFAEPIVSRATLNLRATLRDVVQRGFRWNVPYLPNAGKVDGTVSVVFDQLNPRVIEALRTLETRVVADLTDGMRTSVLQTIERGLVARQAPSTIARTVRDVVGLSPRHEAAIANYRTLLETGDRAALSRLLRDRRFDRTLERALGAKGEGLSAQQINTMVDAYRRKAIAANAETISGTATRDAYKIANRESWQSAIDRGIVDDRALFKEWVHLPGQRHPRPQHEAMDGERVRFSDRYSNGDAYAGEHDPWNCHCIDRVVVVRV